jgi:hypothetical protein
MIRVAKTIGSSSRNSVSGGMKILELRDLMETNSASRELRDKRRILLIGSCLTYEHPEIVEKYVEGRVALKVCLEREHFNMACLKLASIVARVPIEEIVVLTVDGSPHCIQLHFMMDEVEKVTGKSLNVKHIVVYKGKEVEVDRSRVKKARYLSKLPGDLDDNTSIRCQ